MHKPHIIGIAGTNGAGKGTVAAFISEAWGFEHFSVRGLLEQIIAERGLDGHRDVMTQLANELRAEHGPSYLVEELIRRAARSGKDAIIESIRTTGEVAFLRKQENAKLVAVDADIQIRYERVLKRGDSTDDVSFQEFIQQEIVESSSKDPGVQNLRLVVAMADHKFNNDRNFQFLSKQVTEFMNTLELQDTSWI